MLKVALSFFIFRCSHLDLCCFHCILKVSVFKIGLSLFALQFELFSVHGWIVNVRFVVWIVQCSRLDCRCSLCSLNCSVFTFNCRCSLCILKIQCSLFDFFFVFWMFCYSRLTCQLIVTIQRLNNLVHYDIVLCEGEIHIVASITEAHTTVWLYLLGYSTKDEFFRN